MNKDLSVESVLFFSLSWIFQAQVTQLWLICDLTWLGRFHPVSKAFGLDLSSNAWWKENAFGSAALWGEDDASPKAFTRIEQLHMFHHMFHHMVYMFYMFSTFISFRSEVFRSWSVSVLPKKLEVSLKKIHALEAGLHGAVRGIHGGY